MKKEIYDHLSLLTVQLSEEAGYLVKKVFVGTNFLSAFFNIILFFEMKVNVMSFTYLICNKA